MGLNLFVLVCEYMWGSCWSSHCLLCNAALATFVKPSTMLGSVFNRHQKSSSESSRTKLRVLTIGKDTYPYSEFRGLGSPGVNLGQPGDIYIDITPGLHALYARYPESWMLWPGANDALNLLRHPLHSDRCLWCQTTVGWIHPRRVRVNSGEWHFWGRNLFICLNICPSLQLTPLKYCLILWNVKKSFRRNLKSEKERVYFSRYEQNYLLLPPTLPVPVGIVTL